MTHGLSIACAALALLTGCARPVRMAPDALPAADCRTPVSNTADVHLTWVRPDDPDQRHELDERCAPLDPPLVVRGASRADRPVTRLVVVTWNLHDGRGDVAGLLRDIDDARGTGAADAHVLLLQEYVRATPQAGRAARLVPPVPTGWHLAYVPTRRTESPGDAAPADRGTAILSSLPLDDIEAIELPIERQRRIALAATIRGLTVNGRAWRARVVSAHLENRPGAGRLWVRAGAARTRQVEALLDALDIEPDQPSSADAGQAVVIGADLNTWLGRNERAWSLLRERFPALPGEDTRPTLGFGLRVDHLFARLPAGTLVAHRRLDDRHGSDHHAVVAAIDFDANQDERAARGGRPAVPLEP